jgi:Protein of unknown function (DUF2397)
MEGEPGSTVADASAPANPSLRVFTYAVAEKSVTYVAVVDALMAAKERFQLQMRPGELLRLLVDVDSVAAPPAMTVEEVTDALESLFGWGNVNRFYDPAAPETLDEFYAKRFLYQLTEAGVAAHDGIRAVRRVGLDSGRLSGVLLPAIVEGLKSPRKRTAKRPIRPSCTTFSSPCSPLSRSWLTTPPVTWTLYRWSWRR